MMRSKKIIAASIALLAITFAPSKAQSITSAGASFDTFVALYNGGLSGDELYQALFKCYTENMNLAKISQSKSEEELEAKNNLCKIWPYLKNAAAYYSSKGNNNNALIFAKAYVDIPLMGIMSDQSFNKDQQYPTYVYFAASGCYNSRDYKSAIKYFKEYLATNVQDRRRDVYLYMALACDEVKDYGLAQKYLAKAISEFPNDSDLLKRAINNCINDENYPLLAKYLEKALAVNPSDSWLLFTYGKTLEDMGEYQKAITYFRKYTAQKPQSLDGARHLAVNYYNVGAQNVNKGMTESDVNVVKRYNSIAKDYFDASIPVLQNVVANDPMNARFVQALAIAYKYSGREDEFSVTNDKLASMGMGRVSGDAVPEIFSMSGKKLVDSKGQTASENEIPLYSDYARKYIEAQIQQWQVKDPYETIKEYQERVNATTRDAKVSALMADAQKSYIDKYATGIKASDIHLRPYDAENEVFLAESKYGEIIIPVPRANNEARNFESSWNGVKLYDAQYCMDGDKIAVKSLSFITPTGNRYHYDNANALNYTVAKVDVDFGAIDYSGLNNGNSSLNKVNKSVKTIGNSDVDRDIPQTDFVNSKAFAVVIANEDYKMVAKVPMAANDGKTVAKYFNKVFGLPESNIRLYENATYGTMLSAMREIRQISEAYQGDIDIYFYYAGHGIPNEESKDGYLLPVDADGLSTEVCYPLSRLYKELGSLDSRKVVVLLDACFSGANRDGQMLASARGVALNVNEEQPQGNMIAFSAATGSETAYPYETKSHGLFTYFLLKKLQMTAGKVTMKELSDYVIENVKQQSIVTNHKSQTPVISPSVSMEDNWQKQQFGR